MSERGNCMLEGLICALYELVVKASRHEDSDRVSAGHDFEEETARLVYLHEKTEGLKANQPRLTLQMPTISGLTYQFDASFSYRDFLFLIECKKRKALLTGGELVHYFASKVLDYELASRRSGSHQKMRGIFMSTHDAGDSGHVFGLAFGVRVIDPVHPPLEYMLSKLPSSESALKRSFTELHEKMSADFVGDVRNSPASIYKEYQFLRGRWEKVAGSAGA